jgi:hypothetical protein
MKKRLLYAASFFTRDGIVEDGGTWPGLSKYYSCLGKTNGELRSNEDIFTIINTQTKKIRPGNTGTEQ